MGFSRTTNFKTLLEEHGDIVVELQALLVTDLYYRGNVRGRACFEFGSSNSESIKWILSIFNSLASRVPGSLVKLYGPYALRKHNIMFVQLLLPEKFATIAEATYGNEHVGRVWRKRIPDVLIEYLANNIDLAYLYVTRVLEADGGIEVYDSNFKVRLLVTCDDLLAQDFTKLLTRCGITYYTKCDTSKLKKGWRSYISVYLGGSRDSRVQFLSRILQYLAHPRKKKLVVKILKRWGNLEV